MSDHAHLLELFKERRRQFVDQLAYDDEHSTAALLGDTHSCVLAIEAVMAEPEAIKTGPKIEHNSAGWPI